MKTLPATLKKQDLGACLSGVLFKISDGHPPLFYMGISPHLPGSEISAFVRFCLNPLLRWNKSEIKLHWLLNGLKKRHLHTSIMMILTATSNAVLVWPATQSYLLAHDHPEYRLCHVRIIEF